MNNIINGKKIAAEILRLASRRVARLKKSGLRPSLAVVLVGDDKSSEIYVRRKAEAAKKIGLEFFLHKFPSDIGLTELLRKIEEIQNNKKISGLIVQLPLPANLNTQKILNSIREELDVDCLNEKNFQKLADKTAIIYPPTPAAILFILQKLDVKIQDKKVAIIGAGPLVGKPLAVIMETLGARVTILDSRTKNTGAVCREADIIVSGAGKKDLVRGNMIKKGAVVIDAGISFENGRMYGDVNMKEAKKIAKYVTPTPGGVGPVTVACLLANVVTCAERMTGRPRTSVAPRS